MAAAINKVEDRSNVSDLKAQLANLHRQREIATAKVNECTMAINQITDKKVQLMIDVDASMNGLLSLQTEVAEFNDEEMVLIEKKEKILSSITHIQSCIDASTQAASDIELEINRMELVSTILKKDKSSLSSDDSNDSREKELEKKISGLVDELVRLKEKYAALQSTLDLMEEKGGITRRSISEDSNQRNSFQLQDIGLSERVSWIQQYDAVVDSWTRSSDNRITYGVTVRALLNNKEWSVDRSYAQFKELKSKLDLKDNSGMLITPF
jgi:hypothetical protein